MCLNIGTPKIVNFSFEINGKLMALGVPILKHFRVHHKLHVTEKLFSNMLSYLYKTASKDSCLGFLPSCALQEACHGVKVPITSSVYVYTKVLAHNLNSKETSVAAIG